MKNSVSINNFESAVKFMNETKDERKMWYMQERTLARLLKVAQEKKMLPFTRPLFEKVGLPTNGKLTQKQFLAKYVLNFCETKDGKLPAYVRKSPVYERDENKKCKKDKDGKYIISKDVNGNEIFTFKLTPIKNGTWTLEKLLKSVCPA